jgi:electron transport complex protein RnfB
MWVIKPDPTNLASRILAALPQTQCTRCSYPDCAAYADAIAQGKAHINQCPPGGAEGVARLAAITGQHALALNPDNGLQGPRSLAVIDEAWCIGCTLCLPVCPTDAILGSNKMMHTVIDAACTGCELCVAVCPVDCISLENVTGERTGWNAWSQEDADRARSRYEFHIFSHPNRSGYSSELVKNESKNTLQNEVASTHLAVDTKHAMIQAALAKARAARTPHGSAKL